jgi:hypothetical protein
MESIKLREYTPCSALSINPLGFAGTVFKDAPRGRIYVRVFIGMSVRVL